MRTTRRHLSVFVTVGMGPWPFDRLIMALPYICGSHDVFAQTGTSSVVPPCPHERFLSYTETQRRMAEADVVITHGGNTVRLVQRLGKIPVAVAREAGRGEMRNDHQVRYLRAEAARQRVVVVDGDLSNLAEVVERHRETQERLLTLAAPLGHIDSARVCELLEHAGERSDGPEGDPFWASPTARYRWAFEQLKRRAGLHLELGIGDGAFLGAVHGGTSLRVIGADPHPDYLRAARGQLPELPVVRVRDRLPFSSDTFDSASLLDVLEHTADERATLAEVHRVLRPGALLLVTVPGRHVFSFMDPDDAKFRFPRLHRAVYSARFGADVYRRRFVDASDGLRGDMAWTRPRHTNYRAADVLSMLEGAGFIPQLRDGANLFWRFIQIPAVLAPDGVEHVFDRPLRADARMFHRANLFFTAVCDQ